MKRGQTHSASDERERVKRERGREKERKRDKRESSVYALQFHFTVE